MNCRKGLGRREILQNLYDEIVEQVRDRAEGDETPTTIYKGLFADMDKKYTKYPHILACLKQDLEMIYQLYLDGESY